MYYYRHMKLAGKPTLNPLVSSVGATRRLRALNRNGWGQRELARLLGASQNDVYRWLKGDHPRITVKTDKRIRDLFSKLWATPGGSDRAIAHAKRNKYMPALAWDDMDDPAERPTLKNGHRGYTRVFDEVAVELALNGHKPHLHPLETREVVRRLHAKAWTDVRIAEWIGMSDRQVFRVRQALGLPSWDAEHADTMQRLNY